MATGKDVLVTASKEIGYHQGKDQHNIYGEWFGMDNCPWCVIFAAAWVYNHAGIVGDVVGRKYKEGGLYSCSQTLNWYRKHQPECITKDPVPGCLVIFDFPDTRYSTDHMGLFVSKTDYKITTVDGNTSNTSQGNGGWVQQRQRYFKDLAGVTYIKPRELEDGMTIDDLIRDITPAQVYELAKKMNDSDLYKLYSRVESYMDKMPLPTTWPAKQYLDEAVAMGITDGTRPMVPAKRYEAALMAMRAAEVDK